MGFCESPGVGVGGCSECLEKEQWISYDAGQVPSKTRCRPQATYMLDQLRTKDEKSIRRGNCSRWSFCCSGGHCCVRCPCAEVHWSLLGLLTSKTSLKQGGERVLAKHCTPNKQTDSSVVQLSGFAVGLSWGACMHEKFKLVSEYIVGRDLIVGEQREKVRANYSTY